MTTSSTEQDANSLQFPDGNRARLYTAAPGEDVNGIPEALGIERPKALLLIVGSTDGLKETTRFHLVQLFSRGLARAAAAAEAMLIDDGANIGVAALMGQGVADRGRKSVLLGVTPGPADAGKLDANHSHFVLVGGDLPGKVAETTVALAAVLAIKPSPGQPTQQEEPSSLRIPVVLVLVGGDDAAKDVVLQGVRKGWPVLVIQDSGALADELNQRWQQRATFIEDPALAEIVADGDLHLFPLDATDDEPTDRPRALEQRILHLFHQLGGDNILQRAWQRFAVYDFNAIRHQRSFDWLQFFILALGVVAVFLALLQAQLFGIEEPAATADHFWYDMLHYAIIVAPILISVLLAASNRFKAGNKWIMLRAASESIKREIYRYRARSGIYSNKETTRTTREAKLAEKLKEITGRLTKTAVNEAALRPYSGPIPPVMYGAAAADDGVSYLSPSEYITVRLGDQFNYFNLKTNRLERKLKRLQWGIYIIGGVGTLLAAVGFELWVALSTSLAAAFATYLEYRQTENTLIIYNQVATDLDNILSWWLGLSAAEQANPTNQSLLVEQTEEALADELKGWVKQMTDALAALQEKQVKESEALTAMPEAVQALQKQVQTMQETLATLQGKAPPEEEAPAAETEPAPPAQDG